MAAQVPGNTPDERIEAGIKLALETAKSWDEVAASRAPFESVSGMAGRRLLEVGFLGSRLSTLADPKIGCFGSENPTRP